MIQISEDLTEYAKLTEKVDYFTRRESVFSSMYAQRLIQNFMARTLPKKPHYEELCKVLISRIHNARQLLELTNESERRALLEVLV
jgi:hypothetical protein